MPQGTTNLLNTLPDFFAITDFPSEKIDFACGSFSQVTMTQIQSKLEYIDSVNGNNAKNFSSPKAVEEILQISFIISQILYILMYMKCSG